MTQVKNNPNLSRMKEKMDAISAEIRENQKKQKQNQKILHDVKYRENRQPIHQEFFRCSERHRTLSVIKKHFHIAYSELCGKMWTLRELDSVLNHNKRSRDFIEYLKMEFALTKE